MARGAAMIHIREIDHVVLVCADLERMVGFYRDVLGCPVESAVPSLVQLRAGRSLVDLVPGGTAGGRNMDHLCLRVEPFDGAAIAAHLRRHGVDPGEVVPRSGADGAGPSMYIHDPEGNMLELKGP